MLSRHVAIVVSTVLLVVMANTCLAQGAEAKRPTVFAPDDSNRGFEDAVSAPDSVLDALLSTEEAKDDSETLDPLDREGKRKCFTVVHIDLGSAKAQDYMANGNCAGLNGAENYWFWIVHVDEGKGKVILFAGGNTVAVMKRKTNKLHDIEEYWAAGSNRTHRVFRYNGSVYKLAIEKSGTID